MADTPAKTGADTSQSRQSIRRGGADYTDVASGPVTKDAGQLNYDANDREALGPVEWDAPGSRPTAP
jgi:hypothetical protein